MKRSQHVATLVAIIIALLVFVPASAVAQDAPDWGSDLGEDPVSPAVQELEVTKPAPIKKKAKTASSSTGARTKSKRSRSRRKAVSSKKVFQANEFQFNDVFWSVFAGTGVSETMSADSGEEDVFASFPFLFAEVKWEVTIPKLSQHLFIQAGFWGSLSRGSFTAEKADGTSTTGFIGFEVSVYHRPQSHEEKTNFGVTVRVGAGEDVGHTDGRRGSSFRDSRRQNMMAIDGQLQLFHQRTLGEEYVVGDLKTWDGWFQETKVDWIFHEPTSGVQGRFWRIGIQENIWSHNFFTEAGDKEIEDSNTSSFKDYHGRLTTFAYLRYGRQSKDEKFVEYGVGSTFNRDFGGWEIMAEVGVKDGDKRKDIVAFAGISVTNIVRIYRDISGGWSNPTD